jgi:hypothetical protein
MRIDGEPRSKLSAVGVAAKPLRSLGARVAGLSSPPVGRTPRATDSTVGDGGRLSDSAESLTSDEVEAL